MGIPVNLGAYGRSIDGFFEEQLGDARPFYEVYAVDGAPDDFIFSITTINEFCYNPIDTEGLILGTAGQPCDLVTDGTLSFSAIGTVTTSTDTYQGIWDFNGTGFADNGLGGDIAADDGVTRLTGNDITFTVTAPSTPEPSALLGLASVLGLGAFVKGKRQR